MLIRLNAHLGAAALLLLVFLTSGECLALDTATRAAGRDLAYEGVEAFQKADYERASERLERAYALLRLPSIALWSARALEKRGLLLEASERYLEASRLNFDEAGSREVQMQAQAEAEEERAALKERIPRVVVDVQGAPPDEVDVTIDGASVARALYGAGRPTNPGEIEVVATWGARTVPGKVALAEGEEKRVTLRFEKASPDSAATDPRNAEARDPQARDGESREVEAHPARLAPKQTSESKAPPSTPADADATPFASWQKTTGWVALGLGGASLVVGGATGVIALGAEKDLDENCPNRTCGPEQKSERTSYNNLRIVSGAGFIAGGVLALVGITLLFTAPKKERSATLSPYLGPTELGIHGSF